MNTTPHLWRGPSLIFMLSAAGLLTGGCRAEIDYTPDPMVAAPAYAGAFASSPADASTGAWWSHWTDPHLGTLIKDGLAHSLDLKAVEQRLRQAEAVAEIVGAARRPEMAVTTTLEAEWDEDGRRGSRSRPALRGRWQLDLSGALARGAEAEGYRFLARREELNLARLDLSIDIAVAYLNLTTQLHLEKLLAAQEANARESLEVVASRFRQGVATRLDVLQQEDLVADINSQIPSVQTERNRAALGLDILTGNFPGSALRLEMPDTPVELPPRPAIGEPIDLLGRRPDLRALRNELIAADSETARALAERWPRLALEADLFWQEGTSVSGGLVNLVAEIVQPIFDAGRRRAEVNRTEALRQERRLLFSSRFLQAVAQVEDLVFTEIRLSELLQRLERRQRLLEEAEAQAITRYEQGFTDFLPVITARQNLLLIEQRLVRERRNLLATRFNLHRVLGGPMPPP